MKNLMLAIVLLAVAGTGVGVLAAEFSAGDITVSDPWSRASVGAAKNGVVYLTISNRGDTTDRLIAASTTVAARATLHESTLEGGVMKMRPVAGVPVGPGTAAVLAPGSLHIMLMNLERPLKAGEMFPVELVFETAGKIRVEVMVGRAGALHGPMTHD